MDFEYIHLRVPKELKDKLTKQAKGQGLSLTSYINLILRKR